MFGKEADWSFRLTPRTYDHLKNAIDIIGVPHVQMDLLGHFTET
jgi:hypothetical protein